MTKSNCKDFQHRGYCLLGRECPHKHSGDCDTSNDLIELDISDYAGLMEAKHKAHVRLDAQIREEQIELKRKQADLLSNLISQQRALIEKIELCQDEGEKSRLKVALDEMSQKTKDWIEQEGARSRRSTVEAKSHSQSTMSTPSTSSSK